MLLFVEVRIELCVRCEIYVGFFVLGYRMDVGGFAAKHGRWGHLRQSTCGFFVIANLGAKKDFGIGSTDYEWTDECNMYSGYSCGDMYNAVFPIRLPVVIPIAGIQNP